MPWSVPPVALAIAGLDRLPDGQISSPFLTAVPLRQAHGFSIDFGISEIALAA
jgi:hypothetical protein